MGRKSRVAVREKKALPAVRWLSGIVLCLALFSAIAPCLTRIELSDEGVTVLGAQHLAAGQIPHRDFFALVPPLSFAVLALPFKLFGASVLTARLTGTVVGIALVLLIWRLAERAIPHSPFSSLPLALLAMGGTGMWPFPSHHWVAGTLVAGSVLAGFRAAEEDDHPGRWAALSGGLAGLSALALQDLGGLFILLAAALWIPLLPPGPRGAIAKPWYAGLAIGGVLPLLVLVVVAGFSAIWSDLILYPLQTYWAIPGNRLPFLQPLHEIAGQWLSGSWRTAPLYTAAASVAGGTLFALPFISPLPVVFARSDTRPTRAMAALLTAGALAFALTAARRWAPINLIWGTALPAVALAWLLARWHGSSTGWRRRLTAALAVLVGAACLWTGVARGVRALNPATRFPVVGQTGTLYEFDPGKARGIQGLLDAIEVHVPKGSPLLCRELPLVNFLSGRPNPSRYDLFFPPNATTVAQVAQAIGQMESERWEWVATPVIPLREDQPFDRYLKANYEVVWANPRLALWKRIPKGLAP